LSTESSLRADIVEVGRRMYARGYTASNDGNISVRLDAARLLMTPKSVCKGFMTPDMMCITDLEGRKLQGDRDPSSETLMHLEVYRQRPDVQAVVHAHPPTATGFAVAGIPLDRAVLAEVLTTLGSIPIAEYATPSTKELPEAVRKYIRAHDGMLLANHGALTVGADLFGAYYKMETIEHFAKISLVARMLGRENLLSREEVTRLQDLRGTYGIQSPAPICAETSEDESCQVVQAPAGGGRRLVPELVKQAAETNPPSLAQKTVASYGETSPKPSAEAGPPPLARDGVASYGEISPKPSAKADGEGEIRLTYRELSALIEEAIRSLR
jgi:L-fuculose-phosphate aldolase